MLLDLCFSFGDLRKRSLGVKKGFSEQINYFLFHRPEIMT